MSLSDESRVGLSLLLLVGGKLSRYIIRGRLLVNYN